MELNHSFRNSLLNVVEVFDKFSAEGTIISPSYPVPDPTAQNLTWTVTVHESHVVQLDIVDLDLGAQTDECVFKVNSFLH